MFAQTNIYDFIVGTIQVGLGPNQNIMFGMRNKYTVGPIKDNIIENKQL